MERNAHRLTLHSPAGMIVPHNRVKNVDIAQFTRGFLAVRHSL
ncbi:hypothetical protein F157LOC_01262 [Pectobacterium brasiliense]|nr:hypothetical protein F157LOC_01262 [Pectobacterium brasiliense]GKV78388.1 hypothetical protein PEC106568_35610 [Pectobacterium carotovorum subsp. carotovorum]